jgi:hypothetical protein
MMMLSHNPTATIVVAVTPIILRSPTLPPSPPSPLQPPIITAIAVTVTDLAPFAVTVADLRPLPSPRNVKRQGDCNPGFYGHVQTARAFLIGSITCAMIAASLYYMAFLLMGQNKEVSGRPGAEGKGGEKRGVKNGIYE